MRHILRRRALPLAFTAGMLVLAATSGMAAPRAGGVHARAGAAAGKVDFPGLVPLCTMPPAPQVTRELVLSRPWREPPPFAPAKVFDNLYFVGTQGVAAWVIATSDGLILIDTLNNEAEAMTFIEGGLRRLGLDPARIRMVIVTHAHGDHTGGLDYIVRRYHPTVVMSATDWAMSQAPDTRIDVPGWADFPKPDVLFDKDLLLTQGDTPVELVVTPGHTPGTSSVLFTARDRSKRHRVVLWGGTGFNFGADVSRYRAYADSAEAMRRRVLVDGIEVFLSNHPPRDQADVKIAALAQRGPTKPNPFVLSPKRVAQAFTTFRECALAQADRL